MAAGRASGIDVTISSWRRVSTNSADFNRDSATYTVYARSVCSTSVFKEVSTRKRVVVDQSSSRQRRRIFKAFAEIARAIGSLPRQFGQRTPPDDELKTLFWG